jgi:hypothetical protein
MKQNDILVLLLALALLLAMLLTFLSGGERSRHGFGALPAGYRSASSKVVPIDSIEAHALQDRLIGLRPFFC